MNEVLRPLTEKVLRSGIVDEHVAALMERWGYLPEGASELARNKDLESATKNQLERLAEDIANEVAKAALLRETQLDLDTIKWPVEVDIHSSDGKLVAMTNGLIDSVGRYYFRPQEIDKDWLVVGRTLHIYSPPSNTEIRKKIEEITEVTELCIGDKVAAIQVNTKE
jgi:hypothetical protein